MVCGGSAPPYGALWRRCRALRPTHSAGRPTEGPRPTPWSKNPRSANPPARRLRCFVLHILNGPTLLHAAASCCVDATDHQVRSSPACLLSPDRRTRILRRVAPDQLALHLHLVPARVRCRLLHAPSHLLALPPSQRPGDDAVVLQVRHPDARPRRPHLRPHGRESDGRLRPRSCALDRARRGPRRVAPDAPQRRGAGGLQAGALDIDGG